VIILDGDFTDHPPAAESRDEQDDEPTATNETKAKGSNGGYVLLEPAVPHDPMYWRYKACPIGSTACQVVARKDEPECMSASTCPHERLVAWLRGDHEPKQQCVSLLQKCVAEAVGTGMIVLFGCGVVCAVTLTGAQQGLWQVSVVWGFGVALAIYSTASISGAHLNPAVSLAFALVRPQDFPKRHIAPYSLAQLLGAIIAAAINLGIYDSTFRAFEKVKGFSRGDPASVLTASCFGEYFPNPGYQYSGSNGEALVPNAALGWDHDTVSASGAFCVEAWGTFVLSFMIFALTDQRNKSIVRKEMVPFFIGFTVAVLLSLYAPLTQAGLNPARDFGPRLVAAAAGWGKIAIPGPENGFWVYIIGPMVGGPLGAAFYEFVVARALSLQQVDVADEKQKQ